MGGADLRPADFWRWDAFEDYAIVVLVMIALLGVVSYAVARAGYTTQFAEAIGILSVACEIAFPIPQVRKIASTGSAAGVRYAMRQRSSAPARRGSRAHWCGGAAFSCPWRRPVGR